MCQIFSSSLHLVKLFRDILNFMHIEYYKIPFKKDCAQIQLKFDTCREVLQTLCLPLSNQSKMFTITIKAKQLMCCQFAAKVKKSSQKPRKKHLISNYRHERNIFNTAFTRKLSRHLCHWIVKKKRVKTFWRMEYECWKRKLPVSSRFVIKRHLLHRAS